MSTAVDITDTQVTHREPKREDTYDEKISSSVDEAEFEETYEESDAYVQCLPSQF